MPPKAPESLPRGAPPGKKGRASLQAGAKPDYCCHRGPRDGAGVGGRVPPIAPHRPLLSPGPASTRTRGRAGFHAAQPGPPWSHRRRCLVRPRPGRASSRGVLTLGRRRSPGPAARARPPACPHPAAPFKPPSRPPPGPAPSAPTLTGSRPRGPRHKGASSRASRKQRNRRRCRRRRRAQGKKKKKAARARAPPHAAARPRGARFRRGRAPALPLPARVRRRPRRGGWGR